MYQQDSASAIRMAMTQVLIVSMVLLTMFLSPSVLLAHDDNDNEDLLALDGNVVERPPIEEHHEESAELGHKLHPIHTANQAKISGWLTAIVQGTAGSKDPSGNKNDMSEGSLSMDLLYEATLDNSGRFMFHLDVQQGKGLINTSPLFVAPNGNPTGPNNDIESFVNDQPHLVEAWYETSFADNKLILTLGQLDPTVYFDTNNYANSEKFQFIANEFGNNTAVEFGGSANFYGAGFRVTYSPSDFMSLTLGSINGDGTYSDMLSRPFTMAEVDLKPKLSGKDGNYRFYYWENHLPHYSDFLTTTGGTTSTTIIGNKNSGLGASIDQALTGNLGVWARVGIQDKKVSQFDRHISGGIQLSGNAFNRPQDVLGIGAGLTMISDDYKKASGLNGDELYTEAYYNIAVKEGFQVTPDIQYISNPGGNSKKDAFFTYGVRAGVMF
ncbi:MAG: carbohydrate porin [Nitrospira sp.]|nr:carbohydrate porin [Nitrospira sp.]